MNLPCPVAVVESLIQAGVNEFVICAGARNSALIVVLAALEEKVRLWQHFDERAAGFFALGRTRVIGKPVAVVTTSGTAVAELLPSVIEAHYQGLPLVALTADRPAHYRGSGAPQAIEQSHLFQGYAYGVDLVESSHAERLKSWESGPLHLNVCLEELDPSRLDALRQKAGLLLSKQAPSAAITSPPWNAAASPSIPPEADRLILAGELLNSELPQLAEHILSAGALVSAEAASGLREVPALQDRLIRCGDATLRHLPLKQVWRFGGVPSVRLWRDLEDRPDIAVQSFSRSGHTGLARVRDRAGFTGFPAPANALPASGFLARDTALYARLGELLDRHPSAEPSILRQLSKVIPHQATVFTGNSLAVREWNLCAVPERGHRVHVLRGANGIDGNLSAFLGIAADKAEAWCVTGDLTALYDLSAPWMLHQLAAGKRRFVVIQNGGGRIFSRLPSLKGLTNHERAYMENPHAVSLKPWAEMWGMAHLSGDASLLSDSTLLRGLPDHAVIELFPDSAATEKFWLEWAEAERIVWA